MSKKEIKRLVILNIPYLILGLLATNLGEAWRLAEGIDKPQTAPRRIRGCVCSLCGPFQFSLLLRKNVKFRDWQVWPLILSPCG